MFESLNKFKSLAIPGALGAGALGAVGAGVFAGNTSYQNREEDGPNSIGISTGVGTSTALYGAAGIGAGAAIVGGPAKTALAGMSTKSMKMPKINTKAITSESVKKFGTKPLVMGGAGALIGAAVGSQVDQDSPGTGAAIGAGAGAVAGGVASAALKGMNLWKKAGPVGRAAAVIAGTASLAIGGRAVMRQPEYQSEDMSESDGSGGYSNTASSGVKNRMSTMGARGDLVFGLNNKR